MLFGNSTTRITYRTYGLWVSVRLYTLGNAILAIPDSEVGTKNPDFFPSPPSINRGN